MTADPTRQGILRMVAAEFACTLQDGVTRHPAGAWT
jgi:hypothetical protein